MSFIRLLLTLLPRTQLLVVDGNLELRLESEAPFGANPATFRDELDAALVGQTITRQCAAGYSNGVGQAVVGGDLGGLRSALLQQPF